MQNFVHVDYIHWLKIWEKLLHDAWILENFDKTNLINFYDLYVIRANQKISLDTFKNDFLPINQL